MKLLPETCCSAFKGVLHLIYCLTFTTMDTGLEIPSIAIERHVPHSYPVASNSPVGIRHNGDAVRCTQNLELVHGLDCDVCACNGSTLSLSCSSDVERVRWLRSYCNRRLEFSAIMT
jgi:hypothetical protein